MKIQMFYDNGQFDIFETDTHVAKIFKNNLISNYSFDLRQREGQELWLTVYYYEVAEEFKDDVSPTDVPISHRRDGWSVLLADCHDMKHLRRVKVDGEVVLIRLFGEIVDAQTLEYNTDLRTYFEPRIIENYEYFARALEKGKSPKLDNELLDLLAIPEGVAKEFMLWHEHVRAAKEKEKEKEEAE